jgi:hypothetical protein
VLRRRPFALPFDDQTPVLAALLTRSGDPLAQPRDAARLVDAALYHRVDGYAAEAVRRGQLALSPGPRGRLARIAAVHRVHSRALRHELADLAPILADACGAEPVCIKGPAIADRFYPEPGLRTFADLDLLVLPAQMRAAVDALSSRGYDTVLEFRPGFGERHGHDVHLRRMVGSRQLDVELHWRIGDDPACEGLDHARMSGGERLALDGSGVGVPPIAEHLVCLTAHLLSDRAKRLIWIQDLALAGEAASERDWRRAFEVARELGLDWVTHRALDYAGHHLGFDRPRPLPAGPPPAWGPLRAVEELDVRASTHVGRLAAMGWHARARYLGQVLVPTREGLAGTVGGDGASGWRLVGRHVRAVALGLRPRGR